MKENKIDKKSCKHKIVSAKNEIVKKGFICLECGELWIHDPRK